MLTAQYNVINEVGTIYHFRFIKLSVPNHNLAMKVVVPDKIIIFRRMYNERNSRVIQNEI